MIERTLTGAMLLLLALVAMPAPAQAELEDQTVCQGLDLDVEIEFRVVGRLLTDKLFACGPPPEQGYPPYRPHCPDDPDQCGPCDFEDPDDSQLCHSIHCESHPNDDTCRNSAECESGFFGRDFDHDGVCDDDDADDDNDGVPDEEDSVPYAQDPVNNAISCALYIPASFTVNCVWKIV
jgi:hypothetical protein